jgi:tRNA(Ile)-lysidine synthetase-like protein
VLFRSSGWRLVWEQEWLVRSGPHDTVPAAEPFPVLRVESLTLDAARHALQSRPLATSSDSAILGADALLPPFEVRARRPGDRVHLLGGPGHRSVARVFQDHRLPARFRAAYPIVADAHGVVWIPGIGVAERARIGDETRSAVRLRLEKAPTGLPESGPAT